jgi:retinol-binding protein 3
MTVTRSFVLIVLGAGIAVGQTPAGAPRVSLPSTQAGAVVAEWLDAFNSGDTVRLGSYYRKHQLVRSLEIQLNRRNATGGYELVSVERSEPRLLEFVVKERNTGTLAFGAMELGDSAGMKQSYLSPVPPGGSIADFKIDAATLARVIDTMAAKLNENYVFADVAKKMEQAVRDRAKRGEYDGVSGPTLASRLTEHFREVSHDKHLGVSFSPRRLPPERRGPPDSAAIEQFRQNMLAQNCGFVKHEVMPGNVGYLKFNFFGDPAVCGPTASRAMNSLADADYLIVDLRENGGGDPAMVAYLSSYLFDNRTHLNDLWTRRTNHTEEYWTRDVPGPKYGGRKPIYVLTAARTFSGAEEFSNNLKALQRATIIGETTGGGAHPVSGHRVSDHFTMGVPFARAINPITKTNWEGTGVKPDVPVRADDALAVAQRIISETRKIP